MFNLRQEDKLACLLLISAILGNSIAVEFLPFGRGNGDLDLPKLDDVFSTIDILTDFSFFGQVFRQIHVTTNGIIFFDRGSTQNTPSPFPLTGMLSVAAYWVDSNPREGGDIWYRETFDPIILRSISQKIQRSFVEFNDFTANWAFITTFNNVSRYNCGSTCSNVVNHQTILTTNGIESFVIFLYDRLEYAYGQIGFNAGDGKRFFMLPFSKTNESGAYALDNSNVGIPGEWSFSISDRISGGCNDEGLLKVFPKKIYHAGNQDLSISGPCFDINDGNANVTLGSIELSCSITQSFKLHCITPYFNSLGRVDISVTYKNITYRSFILMYDSTDKRAAYLDSIVGSYDPTSPVSISWDPEMITSPKMPIRGTQQNIYLNNVGEIDFIKSYDVYIDVETTGNIYNYYLKESSVSKRADQGFVVELTLKIGDNIIFEAKYSSFSESKCDAWYQNQPSNEEIRQIVEEESRRNPCQPKIPANLPQNLPGGFVVDTLCGSFLPTFADCYFHPGSLACYRSTNNPKNIAVQCCYNRNLDLIMGPPGAGSLDMVDSSVDKLGHFAADVFPWKYCCNDEKKCDKYYEKRPSVGSEHFVPPSPPVRANGDPHFQSIDGFPFTFNLVGEFTFLQTPRTEVQCRISQLPGLQAAYFSAFAIKTDDEDIIQVELNAQRKLLITVGTSQLYPGVYRFTNVYVDFFNDSAVSISTTSGVELNIYVLASMLHVITRVGQDLKGTVSGLLGNGNGVLTDDLMLRNGSYIPANSSSYDIHYIFGIDWITTANSSIFTYPEGTNWGDYQNFNFVPYLGTPISDDRCQGNMECLFDLQVTGDAFAATSNLVIARLSSYMKEQMDNISKACNQNFNVSNGEVEIGNFDSLTRYELTCRGGFTLKGERSVDCIEGNYTGSLGYCENEVDFSKAVNLERSLALFVVAMLLCFKLI